MWSLALTLLCRTSGSPLRSRVLTVSVFLFFLMDVTASFSITFLSCLGFSYTVNRTGRLLILGIHS